MTETDGENVRLLIRCALQSFDDLSISCLSSWTVLQLKEKLAVDCPSKPEAKRQRLIYAGHCLHDEHTLKSVFELRPIGDGNVHVIHLVCPPKDFSTHLDASVLRRRSVNHTQASSVSLGSATQTQNHNVSGAFPRYTYPLWANAAAQGGFVTPQPVAIPSTAHFQSAYQAYMISYSNYIHQMMCALGSSSNSAHFPSQLLNSQVLQPPQQANQPERIKLWSSEVLRCDTISFHGLFSIPFRNLPPALITVFGAEANLAAAPAAGDAIRMCFLIMLIYVYSSAERFFGVLTFILLVWFIQARRDRNNRERADRELAAAVDNVRQPQQPSQTDMNQEERDAGENTNEIVTVRTDEEEPREPTAWVVFGALATHLSHLSSRHLFRIIHCPLILINLDYIKVMICYTYFVSL
ncbi:Homocysteine-responsive endoplasmic reticulum-resident ubiquitin-like domain member 2 protein [Dirofilaria immitis]|nr:Homocysteine-responsive endoplasmic reticulum-resident ubiquitin-like domain member 2 protein [Dirofilaria immitis]